MVTDYYIVESSDTISLASEVEDGLKDGYEPLGGPFLIPSYNEIYDENNPTIGGNDKYNTFVSTSKSRKGKTVCYVTLCQAMIKRV